MYHSVPVESNTKQSSFRVTEGSLSIRSGPIPSARSKQDSSLCPHWIVFLMAEPSEEQLESMIRDMVATVDLERTGMKKFTKLLSKKFGGIDFSHRKKFIKTTLTDIINEDGSVDEDETEEKEEEEKEENGHVVETKPRRKSSGGLAAVKEISDELAAFLGQGKEMARTEIVKSLWSYIRDHGLQNPDNKREIFLDKRMKVVFGCDNFSMVRIIFCRHLSKLHLVFF